MLKFKRVDGPAAPGGYVQATGVIVDFGEGERIKSAEAFCDFSQVLEADNTIYSLRPVIAGSRVGIHIWAASTVGGGANAWAELAGATALDTRLFTVVADIE